MRYGCYADGFRFDSHLADFRFVFFFTFFQAWVLRLGVSVRLGLRLGLGLGFIFYVLLVSTKPTALSSYVTVMSQVAY